MGTDAKQQGILVALLVLGLMIFLVGGTVTGAIDIPRFFSSTETAESPEFDPEYLYARAFQLYESNDRAMSRDIARRVVHLKPTHKEAHKLLAAIAMRDQDYSVAAEECQRLVEIDPADMNGYLGLGNAFRKLGQNKKAEEVFRTVLNNDFSNERQREEAHLNLAELNPPAPADGKQGMAKP